MSLGSETLMNAMAKSFQYDTVELFHKHIGFNGGYDETLYKLYDKLLWMKQNVYLQWKEPKCKEWDDFFTRLKRHNEYGSKKNQLWIYNDKKEYWNMELWQIKVLKTDEEKENYFNTFIKRDFFFATWEPEIQVYNLNDGIAVVCYLLETAHRMGGDHSDDWQN